VKLLCAATTIRWTVVAAGLVASATCPLFSADPLFPDPALEAEVRRAVIAKRDNKEPIMADDVKSLSVLQIRDAKVKDLRGIENCAALLQFDLVGTEVSDIGALKALVNLQSLTLSRNRIKDISPLSGMNKLQYLELSGNQVIDIAPVAQMTAMNSLYLSGNQIVDLAPVAGLTRLWSLYADGNPVVDLKPLGGLKNLSSLDLRRTKVKDLAALAPLQSLGFLLLDGAPVSDVAPLVAMCRKDQEGEKRFAPYLRVSLVGTPVAAKPAAVAELRKVVHTVMLTETKQ
jgi:internalin A